MTRLGTKNLKSWSSIALAVALAGCGGSHVDPGASVGPLTTGGSVVTVALAGVALGGDCAGARACAINVPNCGCQQSALQLQLKATQGHDHLALQIVGVRVSDPSTGQVLEQLTARSPQKWNGTAYVAWDGQIAPGDDFNASYLLSAPHWADLSPTLLTKTYRVEVELSIGGQTRTIGLDGVSREPPINT